MAEIPLNACKLVEETESGELVLLKENLSKLIEHWCIAGDISTPIALVSVLGPKLSGKSFYTNLLTEYLKYDGKTWTQSMKTSGLKGFPYGPDDNRVTSVDESVQEDVMEEEMGSGVYFWPKLFPLKLCNGEKLLLLVMHVHRNRSNDSELDEQQQSQKDALNIFLGVASSRILDIIWKDISVAASLASNETPEMKGVLPLLCQSIVYLERRITGGNEKPKGSVQDNVVTVQELTTPLHDKKGVTNFKGPQQRAMEKIFRNMIDETALSAKTFGPEGITLKIGSLGDFLHQCVNLVNYSRGLKTSSDPDSFLIQAVQNGSNSENMEPEGMGERQKNNSLGNNSEEIIAFGNGVATARTLEGEYTPMDCSPPTDGENHKPLVIEKAVDLEYLKREVVCPIWPKLHTCLMKWITDRLKKENVTDIQNLFETFLENLNRECMVTLTENGMSEEKAMDLIQSVRKDTDMMPLKNAFLYVEKSLQDFCTNIDGRFSNTAWFPPDGLKMMLRDVIDKIIATMEPQNVVINIFEHGTSMIIPFYESHNHKKMNEEKGIAMECIQQIRFFYQDEMKNAALQNQIISPKKLVQIHKKLFSELQAIFKLSMGPVVNISGLLTDLERHLNKDFLEVERRNMRSIEMIQKKVINLVFKAKSEYETKMDELFEQNPHGIPKEKIKVEDTKIEKETIKNFQTDAMTSLSSGTSLYKHLPTLDYYIGQSRECFQEENDAKLEENEAKPEETIRKTKTANPGPSQICESEPRNLSGQPPLLVQLGTEKVGIGIIKSDTIDVRFIPPLIGVTEDKEWVCGNEVATLTSPGQHFRQWNIGDCLLGKQFTSFGETTLNDIPVQITTEFLLAVFLRNIKQANENDHLMNITEVKITVPFWCPSPQRQQILDAAQMADFTNAQIMNENSAAAYYMFESRQHDPYYSSLVLSVNSNMFDATLYSFDPQKMKLLMLSHCGDCDTNSLTQKRNHGWLAQKFYSLYYLLMGTPKAAPKGEKMVLDKMLQLCEKAINRAEKLHGYYPVRNVLISCQSEKWTELVKQVVPKIKGIHEIHPKINNCAPIYGMASIQNVISMNNITELSLEKIIRDGMPFYVNVYPPCGERRPAFSIKDTFTFLPNHGSRICSFQLQYGDYRITQENLFSNSNVANLTINNGGGYSASRGIAVTLQRSHQGIISLANLHWTRITMTNFHEKVAKVAQDDYEWINCSMADEDKGKYISLMEFVNFHNNLAARLAKGKKSIEKSCEIIIDDINNGKGNFKSPFAKKLVLTKLKETMQELGLGLVTENELKQHREILKNILSTYNLG